MLALLLAVTSIGPLPGGATSLTVLAGRPFYSVRLDHGLSDRFDVGAGLDVSSSGFVRPVLRSRVGIWAGGPVRFSLRVAAAYVMPTLKSGGFGPRPIAHTADGELGLNLDWSLATRLWAFAEVSALGESDGKVEHSAAFVQALAGFEWATPGPLSLIARGGVLQGSRARAPIGSAGVAWHF